MTEVVVVEDMPAGEVERKVSRLGLLHNSIKDQFVKYCEIVTELYKRRAWIAAGFASWDEFARHSNIVINVDPEARQQVSAILSNAGMSGNAIAVTQGVTPKTTSLDLSKAGVTSGNTPRTVKGLDEKEYTVQPVEKRRQAPRRALPTAFTDALWDLEKVIARLERQAKDDRWSANRKALDSGYNGRVFALVERLEDFQSHDLMGLGRTPAAQPDRKEAKPSADLSLVNDVRLYLGHLASSPDINRLSPIAKQHIIDALHRASNQLDLQQPGEVRGD